MDAELVQLWDRPGLSWDVRQLLEPAIVGFEEDPGKSKLKNLEMLLSRLPTASREQIETLSLKKPAGFYDRVKAAMTAERELLASRITAPDAEFDAIAASFQDTKPAAVASSHDDEMELAGYAVQGEISAFDDATKFLDELLAMKAGRT